MKGFNLKLLVLFMFLLVLFPIAFSQDYYADIVVDIDESGNVDILGNTNLEILTQDNQSFTSKKGIYWTLNYTINQELTDYIIEINLPKNVEINYLKIPSLNRIVSGDKTKIITSGTNSKINLVVQYSFIRNHYENVRYWFVIILGIFGLSVFFIVLFLHKKILKKSIEIDESRLTDRQKQIMKIILKNPKGITQSKLEQITKLPKASLSRNVASLERLELIQKHEYGMSNLIMLKKK